MESEEIARRYAVAQELALQAGLRPFCDRRAMKYCNLAALIAPAPGSSFCPRRARTSGGPAPK